VAVRRKKYLQATQALNNARLLNADHPDLHVRTVEFRRTVSSLPQTPPVPIGPALTEFLSATFPEDISLETYNSQYLQKHSSSGPAVLAAAKVSHMLGASREEVEAVLFTTFAAEAQLDIKTALAVVLFLGDIQSPRQDEYRIACDAKFELATVFKTPSELEVLRKGAAKGDTVEDADNLEVIS